DADWVILSACNAAAGNAPNAETLSGLARAFFYAGARSLLVSHWAVDSEAAVKLVTSAVREISRDETVGRAEALRRAMLTLVDGGSVPETHPAYWAPFIIVGEGASAGELAAFLLTRKDEISSVTATVRQDARSNTGAAESVQIFPNYDIPGADL